MTLHLTRDGSATIPLFLTLIITIIPSPSTINKTGTVNGNRWVFDLLLELNCAHNM